MEIAMVMAMSSTGVIGHRGKLPWAGKLRADMEHFQSVTQGGYVIVGRKTYESIPSKYRPLPKRVNIVLTRGQDRAFVGEGVGWSPLVEEAVNGLSGGVPCVAVMDSLGQALAAAQSMDDGRGIYIIGGAEVYQQAWQMPVVDRLYLTRVQTLCEGDTRFLPDLVDWDLVSEHQYSADGKTTQFACLFQLWQRRLR